MGRLPECSIRKSTLLRHSFSPEWTFCLWAAKSASSTNVASSHVIMGSSEKKIARHACIIIIMNDMIGVSTQAAEHVPLWTHGRRQVSVYILVPSKTLNCSHGHMVSTDNANTSSAVVNARGGGGRRLPAIWCGGVPRSPVSLASRMLAMRNGRCA